MASDTESRRGSISPLHALDRIARRANNPGRACVASTQLIGLAAQLDVADLLSDGPKSIVTLAEATGTREPALRRVMRALAALGTFAKPQPSYLAITALGETLLTGAPNSLRDYAILLASGMMLRGWPNLLHALRTSEEVLDDDSPMLSIEVLQHRMATPSTCTSRRRRGPRDSRIWCL
jgi:hypothetical protein